MYIGMRKLIEPWNPIKVYEKLELVMFMDKIYQSTIDNNVGVLPLIPRQINSPIMQINDQDLIDKIIDNYFMRDISVTQNSIENGKYKWAEV
jgi:hypothetical protein